MFWKTFPFQSKVLSLYTVPQHTRPVRYTHVRTSLSVCVRTWEGEWTEADSTLASTQRTYQGTRAVLLLVYVPTNQQLREVGVAGGETIK